MSFASAPSHRWSAAAALTVAAAVWLSSGAQAKSGAGGTARTSEPEGTLSWNGVEIRLWSISGQGLHAYRIVAPANLATGWRYCESSQGRRPSIEQCIGAWPPPAR